MSYPAPSLHVEPSGGMGELFVRIEGELRPVLLLSMEDRLDEGGDWELAALFPTPGLYRLSGFENFVWYTLTALHVDGSGIPLSPAARPVKSRPEFRLPSRAVDIVQETSQEHVVGRTNAFRGKIKAWPVRGMTGAIFLYRRELFGSGSNTRDVFEAVCKPGDLALYPEGDVGDDPYYRLDYVDLIDRAYDHRDENWDALLEDVQELVNALKLEDTYRSEETL